MQPSEEEKLTYIPQVLAFSVPKGALSKNVIKKGAWFFVIICAISILSYQISTVIVEFNKYLVNTVVTIESSGFRFPDITICKKDHFNTVNQPLHSVGIVSAMRFWKFALNLTDSVEDKEIMFMKAMSSFQEYAYGEDQFVSILNDIHICKYLEKPCELSDFHPVDLHPFFNCIQFIPKNRQLMLSGYHFGLQLIISSGDSYSINSPADMLKPRAGYDVIIHEHTNDPLEVMPWTQVKIRLEMKKYTKVNSPVAPCYNLSYLKSSLEEFVGKMFPEHRYGECKFVPYLTDEHCFSVKYMISCLMRCHCLPNSIVLPTVCSVESMDSCHSLPEPFFYNKQIDNSNGLLYYDNRTIRLNNDPLFAQVMKRVTCYDRVMRSMPGRKHHSPLADGCPTACVESYYESALTAHKWPHNRVELIGKLHDYESQINLIHNVSLMKNQTNRKFSSILIYPSTLNLEETRQELAYPRSKLISDIGGSIGMCVGCSILTLVELFEVLLNLISRRLLTRHQKKPAVELDDQHPNHKVVESDKVEHT